MRSICRLLPGLIALFLVLAPVHGITVSGAIIFLEVDPGDPFHYNMTLSLDPGEKAAEIYMKVIGMGQTLDGSNREIDPTEDHSQFTARLFLNVSPKSVYLVGGEYKTILLEGRLPNDVGSGARYAMLKLGTDSNSNETEGVALAVPVIIRINGTEMLKQGKITLLEGKAAADQKTVNVTLIFNNTGNYHYKTLAEVILKDNQNVVLANTTTKLGIFSILPGAELRSEIELDTETPLKAGIYSLEGAAKLADGTVLDKQTGVLKVVPLESLP